MSSLGTDAEEVPEGAYRGTDRRQVGRRADAPRTVGPVAAGAALAALAALVLAVDEFAGAAAAVGFDLAAAVAAVAAGVLCLLGWRVAGRAPLLWAGVGMLVAGAGVGVAGLAASVVGAGPGAAVAAAGRPAGLLVGFALLAGAAVVPPVSAAVRPARLLLAAVPAVVLLTAVAAAASAAPAGSLGGVASALRTAAASGGGRAVFAGGLLLLAAGFLWRATPDDGLLWTSLTWLGLALAGVGVSVGVDALAGPGDTSSVGGGVVRLAAVTLAVYGTARALQQSFAEQSTRLLDSLVTAATAEARVAAERTAARRHAHDACSALAAIEGASRTLERAHDRLDEATRASLSSGISREIERLQRLVGASPRAGTLVAFRLRDALDGAVARGRRQGAAVSVEVPDDLEALGNPVDTAEVVSRVLGLAVGQDRPEVAVRAALVGARVVVRVEVPHAPGSWADGGIEAGVCARLMAEQGGEWAVDRRPEATAFALGLPSPGGLGRRADAIEEADDHRQITEVDDFLAVESGETADTGVAGVVGQDDQNVAVQTGRKGPGDERHIEA